MTHTITSKCTGCALCAALCPVKAISGAKKKLHAIDRNLCINCGACGRICNFDAVLEPFGTVAKKIKRSEWPQPAIDLKKCYSCNNCVEVCPSNALSMAAPDTMDLNPKNKKKEYAVLSDPKKCISCSWCSEYCGYYAISMEAASKKEKAVEQP